ncbi:MAG: carboxypeptidase-like regulatory domain-containing protein [Chitinophagaceae bacterium]|jgi:hypothetical protein
MRHFWFIVFLLLSTTAGATTWRGTITDGDSKLPIQGVTITNTASQMFVVTDERGQFNIEGNPGDKVTFYCPGYRGETHVIIPGLEGIRLTFALRLSSRELQEVVIKQKFKTQYQLDSAERRSEHSRVLARQKSSIGSPFSFVAEKFSRKQKDMFRFQKNFNRMEVEQFTDSRYSPELVNTLTNLGGDTLAYFMNTYKMPYDYARTATALELKMWVRYNFKTFMQETDSMRKLKLPY